MGREEGFAVDLEVALILVEHAIQPGQQLLCAVVGVQNDRNTVGGSNAADVVSSCDGTGNGSLLIAVGNTLDCVTHQAIFLLYPLFHSHHHTFPAK